MKVPAFLIKRRLLSIFALRSLAFGRAVAPMTACRHGFCIQLVMTKNATASKGNGSFATVRFLFSRAFGG